jgi:cytochrome P450
MRSGQAVGATDEDYFDFVEEMTQAPGHDLLNLHPRLARLREQGPVHEGKMWELLGLGTAPNRVRREAARDFAVVGFDAATQLLRDATQVSSRIWQKTAELTWGYNIVVMDDPDHRRYRALIEQAFTRHAMENVERDIVVPVVEQVVDSFADRRRVDLVREFTFRFPILIIARMLGLPDEDIKQYHVWGTEVILFDKWERALGASQALADYLVPIIEERRAEPRDDMISALIEAELDGDRLSNDAILAFLRNLVTAGAETTFSSSGSLLFGLLTNPDQLEALRKDRSLIPQAMEEGIRWEPPLTNVRRELTRDVELAGVRMPAGSFVYISLAAANRDATRWNQADDFDIHRDRHAHLSFGFSTHMCLGMHLARAETTAALNALLDRLPNLRLDPEAIAPAVRGVTFRRPNALPVVWG